MPKKKQRNYRKEYDEYHGTPEQKKRRAQRNKARKESGLKKGDSREVHHEGAPRKGSLAGTKTSVVSRKKNRSIQPKRKK